MLLLIKKNIKPKNNPNVCGRGSVVKGCHHAIENESLILLLNINIVKIKTIGLNNSKFISFNFLEVTFIIAK